MHKFQGTVISANIQSGTLCNYIGNLSHNLEVKMLYTLFDIQMKVRANPVRLKDEREIARSKHELIRVALNEVRNSAQNMLNTL